MQARQRGRRILAIADDLTGALEVGAKFADNGLAACVTTDLQPAQWPDAEVLVLDTETRHESAEAASQVVRDVARKMRQLDPWLIYKKTDSTLRGNIRAEFRAVVDAFPGQSISYVPAYPEMGRTVKNGRLFVHGTPVDKTEFAENRFHAAKDSDIIRMLEGMPVHVLDGESTADIRNAADTLLSDNGSKPLLGAGPAGLAGAIAEYLASPQRQQPNLPEIAQCLVVNGSLHPVSIAQIQFGRENGCFREGWICFDCEAEGSGRDRAFRIGEAVRRHLDSCAFDAIAIFGGDTAYGVHRALGRAPFECLGEIVPGVPLSRSWNLFWITKAGGFAARDILLQIQRRLSSCGRLA